MVNQSQLKPAVLAPQAGRALWHLGALMVFKTIGEETNGQFWTVEGFADKHMAVPLHVHQQEDEFWYVLDGTLQFHIDGETQQGGAGTFVYIPRGVPHTFQVLSETARWFGGGTPAILDQFFFETGEPAQTLTLPPHTTTPPNVEEIVASLKRYGTDTLGPPMNIGY
jgi:mannose-6-phosphate isomerase-like protein (cupin superfamily)